MAGAPRLCTVDQIVKGLRKARTELARFAASLPDEDAYATPYSVLSDGVKGIDDLIDNLKDSVREANQFRKEHPEQFPNRARVWCKINDSRRKPRASAEETEGTES